MQLEIIFEDAYLTAINKPHGLLVHRTPLAKDVKVFALQLLRDQLGQRVYPVHRLDRKTSGVLLFAKSGDIARQVQQQFTAQQIQKRYLAIVRGYFPAELLCMHPLLIEGKGSKACETQFRCLEQSELPIALGKHATSRYSLVEAWPATGRQHQIRRHLNHLRHPIIGDRPHGCNKQNRLFKERWGLEKMLLHAQSLEFEHPLTQQKIKIAAELSEEFRRMANLLGFPF